MKKLSKRFLSLALALTLCLVGSTAVYAAENNSDSSQNPIEVAESSLGIMPLDSNVFVHNGTTSTSWNQNTISVAGRVNLSGSIYVSSPCTLYLLFYNSSGTCIGSKSVNITSAGTYSFTPSPSSLTSGTYTYKWRFSSSGNSYVLRIAA